MLRILLNASITSKMIAILVMVTALFMGALLFEYLPTFERELIKDRRDGLRHMIDVAHSLLMEYQERIDRGEFDQQDAQRRAIGRISHLFYGNNDYFWINDSASPYPTMIMHPIMPHLDGSVLDDESFNCASAVQFGVDGRIETIAGGDKNLFQAFVEVAHESGEGFVTYSWPKPTGNGPTDELYPKESFVKLFEPWGWVIGTGVYIDDIQERLAQLRRSILIFTAIILALATLFFASLIGAFITSPIQALMRYAERISAGDYSAEISGRFYAETARLKSVITKMVYDLESAIAHAETKRLEAQREADAARQLTEKLDALFKSMTEIVVLHELVLNEAGEPVNYRITGCNDAFLRAAGVSKEEIVGKLATEAYHSVEAPYLNEFARVAMTGEPCTFETYYAEWSRHFIISVSSPSLNEFVTITTDITERKRTEEEHEKLQSQLLQAQKLQSVGRLAGGVAHDYNNMLCAILGYAEMAKAMIPPNEPVYKNILGIIKAARHSADITNQLLAFARKQTIQPRELDLNPLITDLMKMLNHLITENIKLYWLPYDSLWKIHSDPSQINQILVNLVVNARDAIADAGFITVETGNFVFDDNFCEQHTDSVPGDYVMLAVSDNGCGMDKETLDQVFEPFFTTKGVGEGTGLGLASVYGIVQQNRGYISVYSERGQGTTFKVFLPRFAGDQRDRTSGLHDASIQSGHEMILLVEDEPMVLEMTEAMVTRLGYSALTANTPAKAIRLAQERASEIDLLMTDVIMPDMDGYELAKTITSYCPRAKVLFMSGYTADVISSRGILSKREHFITKPFTLKILADKIRESLNSDATGMPKH